MADNEEVSEKETTQKEEKEQDTAEDTAKSPTPSKGGNETVKSAPGSAKSNAGGEKGGKGAKGKAGKGKKKAAEHKAPESEAVDVPEGEKLPEGAVPLFLSSKTQEIFDAKVDEDVNDDNLFKFISKEDILKDLFNRAAVSDFSPFKAIVQNYPTDEILVVYDPDFKWGQNFILATTEEAKEKLMAGPEPAEGEEQEDKLESEEKIIYKYIPPEPKEWVSLGSEKEIEEEAVGPTRKKVKFSVVRKRKEFGAFVKFSDRNVADAKDAYQECASYVDDHAFDLQKLELTKGTQAVPVLVDTAAQTDWKYPRNSSTQYESRELQDEGAEKLLKSDRMAEVIDKAFPRFELALQQNHVMDIFFDDWKNLGEDDDSFGNKSDSHLKEYQSFTDLQFSKDKTVTCIDWHPTIKGVVAVSVAEKLSFDDRIDLAHKSIMTPSLILIWSFSDPIHPQLLLEAPDDINCFKFMPTNTAVICGGCINGQVVIWDISTHVDRLKAPRGGKKKDQNTLPGFEDQHAMDTPIVRYCAVSSIEHSHTAPIVDIQWLPDHLEVNKMGVPHENRSGSNVQLITCATDTTVLFWDIRPPKTGVSMMAQLGSTTDSKETPLSAAETFKHLDLTWKPHLRVTLRKSEPGGDHSPTAFSLSEIQGDKSSIYAQDEEMAKNDPTQTAAGGFNFGPAGGRQGSGKRTLSKVKTHFYIGTEDGELVYCDWMPQKDQDTGTIQTPKPDYYHTIHDGAITMLQRSPFFKDIILVIGGWTFSIWKEGIQSGPILQSCASSKKYTGGHWSPTRPSVFFITRQDGSVDTWDLLDRTHEASMNQSVTPLPITCIYPYQFSNKQHLLAVGDKSGTLHILEIPWSLKQPTSNELNAVSNYFEREIQRRAFVVSRWDFREKDKIEMEQEAKRNAGIAPQHHLSDEDQLLRMKMEYQQYLDEEATFLRELGLKETEEEPLPSTD